MTAPNIVTVTSIIGKTNAISLTNTNNTELVSNAANSNKVFKINSLIISNVDGSLNIAVTVNFNNQDNIGGTNFEMISTGSVPADSTLVVVDKTNPIYLEEDRSIGIAADVANKLKAIVSYEEIS
tara:strand:- start:159 stop:533 length:375 start_codon:yes stop_codon:yes gene_type:complete